MKPSVFKVGDIAHVRTKNEGSKRFGCFWDGHYWGNVEIVSLSACGRYAQIEGQISWQRSGPSHRSYIPTALLKLAK